MIDVTDPAETALDTTSIHIPMPVSSRFLGPEKPITAVSSADDVIVSRNGEVRQRSGRIHPFFGWVQRDPENPKRWVARNKRGLPVGGKTSTRAEALDQLTTYIDHTVLETLPVTEHVSVSTGPVAVVTENDPQTLRRYGQLAVETLVGVFGLGVLGLAIWGFSLIS